METLGPKLCRGFKRSKLAFTVTFSYTAVPAVMLLIFILNVTNRLDLYIVKVNKPSGHIVMTSGSCQNLLKNV